MLALHGVPMYDATAGQVADPRMQLAPIREALRLPGEDWQDCQWTTPTPRGAGLPLIRLKNGEFCENYVQELENCIQELLNKVTSDASINILAYSAGALITYCWLANLASARDVERINKIICIAGPHRFRPKRGNIPQDSFYFEEAPNKVYFVGEESVDADRIAGKLRQDQLIVIRGSHDGTVLRRHSAFQRNSAGVVEGKIRQHIVRGADHRTICRLGATIKCVSNYLGLSKIGRTRPIR